MLLSKQFLLGTSLLAGVALAAPALAHAEARPASAPIMTATAASDSSGGSEVDELVVTGSRIKKTEFTSPSPVQVINSEVSTLQGLVDTTEILQRSTLASGSFQVNNQLTGFVTTGGPGANTVGLRGLGATRTLILLNGRRMGPAGTRGTVGPVDLNVIPSGIVDRFEILKDGASSIYGSDAVAGVINIITKTKLDGGSFDLFGDIGFKRGGEQFSGTVAFGHVWERGYLNGSVNYYEQKVLRRGDREDTSCAADLLQAGGPTGALLDYTNTDPGQQTSNSIKCYGLFTRVLRTGNYGDLIYPDAGVTYPTGPGTGNTGGTNNVAGSFASLPTPFGFVRQTRVGFPNTYPYAHDEAAPDYRASVVSPVRRTSVYISGGYDLTPHVQLYGDALFNRRESTQFGARQFFPGVSTANVNIPVAWEAAGPTALGSLLPIIPLNSDRSQRVDYFRGVAGVKGDFAGLGGHNWTWDLFTQYSHSSADYTTDIIYNDRVNAVTGAAACNQAAITISGGNCTSLPAGIQWGSARILNGQFTPEEQAFLFTKETGNTLYWQWAVEGTVTGDVFTLPAGNVGVAVGFSYRHDYIDDLPGFNERNNNLWGSTSAGETKGGDNVGELYGEATVPLIKNKPGFESLDLDGSVRWTHYDSYGDGTTYKVGLNWQIIPLARIRGTYGTSFRAPALYELYLANQTSFLGQTSIDPCINWGLSANPRYQANCAAAGVPSDYTAAGTSSALIITGGGKGILKAETSRAWTVGMVLTPRAWNLSIAFDYFDFDIKNEIRQFGAANIANQCYNSSSFATEPFCTLLTRDATTHQILTLNNSYVNVAEEINRGIDLTTRWEHTFPWAKFTVDTQFTWQTVDVVTLLAGAATNNYNGTTYNFRGPDFTGRIGLRLDRGDWTVVWNVDMIGKGSDTEVFGGDVFNSTRYSSTCRIGNGAPAPCSQLLGQGALTVVPVSAYFKQYTEFTAYHEVSVRKRFDTWTLQVGIQNLFDERPPSQSSAQFRVGTAALNGYDMVGRRVFIDIKKTW